MKPILLKLGMIIAMLLSFQTSSAYSFKVDEVYYNILQDNASVSVTYRNTSYDSYIGDVVIPESVTHDGISYVVTEIGNYAFNKSTTVTSITIPPTIKKIGLYAFKEANHIQKVYITDLSAWCMMELGNFESSPLKYGGSLLLNGQTVSSLDELNASCTKIGKYAFYGNTNLQNVVIPDNIESIDVGAFQGCSGMEYLEVGINVVSMGEGAFKGCSKLKTIKFKDSPNTINLGRYETNMVYPYFKDCPLTTVYMGRNIDWADDTYNYKYYYPFKTVKTAIFNINTNMSYAFTALTDAYIGPNCHEFRIYGTQLANLYVFNDNITDVYLESDEANIYVLDKTNIPQKIAGLKYKQVFNLLEVNNLQNNQSYEYGSLPNLNANQFQSNVESMSIRWDELELNKNVGMYNQGLNITLFNSLWDVVVNVPFTYTITSAPLTIIANNAMRSYGIDNPELTCSFFGFKHNETADVLTKQPKVETTATKDSPVGTYPIIVTGAEAQNYSFNYERGTFTITKANQEIEWNQKFEDIVVGSVIELTAVSSARLPIKYSVTDETIAEIYSQGGKKYVEFLKLGTVSIRANQEGNENYNEADRVSKKVIVTSLVEDVILNQTSLNLTEGETFQLTAVLTPTDASNKRLEWSSTNADVASVDYNGKVTALKQGLTTISAKTTDGSNITVNCEVKVIKAISDTYVELAESNAFTNDEERTIDQVVYTRDFNNTDWQAWYVPFDVNYDEISDKLIVARLNNIHQFDDDDNGDFERWALEVLRLKSGDVVYGNIPYMVKAKEVGEQQIQVFNTTLYKSESETLDCSSTSTLYTFVGTYAPIAGSELADDGCYVMSSGKLLTPTQTTTLKPFRWYLKHENRSGYPVALAPKQILVFENGNFDTTDIEYAFMDGDSKVLWPADVYNLNGQLVLKHATNLDALPKGVYLVKGKKIMK